MIVVATMPIDTLTGRYQLMVERNQYGETLIWFQMDDTSIPLGCGPDYGEALADAVVSVEELLLGLKAHPDAWVLTHPTPLTEAPCGR